uniref:Probable purine permease n=1 Tax=Oryza nivara TaxID=4536 RepID=A0A0E0IL07_ORYNI
MDVEATKDVGHEQAAVPGRGRAARWLLVALNCGMLVVGTTGGPLISRLYFSKGGHRQWLSAWLQTAGWPLLLVPVAASYLSRRARDRRAPLFLTPTRVLLAGVGLGFLNGADDFIYAYGLAYLPVSTSAILISTQLAFTVFFACLIVRQRLTAATLNGVALLTIGAVVLGLHASKDRPAGVTSGKYWMGFFLTLGAAALYGLILPLVELAYKHAAGGGRAVTYALVMEMQLVMGFFATAFCTVGMRLTAATLNAVALLTIGAVVLGLHVSKDRPAGVTNGKYWMGFFLIIGAAALYGLILPLVELAYKHVAARGRAVTYALVMEMQLVMGFFATAFCTVGMRRHRRCIQSYPLLLLCYPPKLES